MSRIIDPFTAVNLLRESPLIAPPRRFYAAKYRNTVMQYLSAVMIDRTQTLLDCGFSNIQILDKIPEPVDPGSFAEIVDIEAASIWRRSMKTGLPIALLYSGGLDSTCVAAGLLKAGAHIHIVGSEASIAENPIFFAEVLKDNPQVTLSIGNPLMRLRNEGDKFIWVTGECGAHLMGTINWSKYGGRELENVDQIEADHLAAGIFRNPEPYFNLPADIREPLLKVLDKSPVTFKTNYDAQWWSIFALKWQFVQFRIQMWTGKICPNLVNFFMTEKFQQWALTHDVSEKCPSFEWRNYKMPIRDYIFAFFPKRSASYDIPKRASMERTYNQLELFDSFVIANPMRVGWVTGISRANVEFNLNNIKSSVN